MIVVSKRIVQKYAILLRIFHHMGRSQKKNREIDRQTEIQRERINTTSTTTIYKLQLNTFSTIEVLLLLLLQ